MCIVKGQGIGWDAACQGNVAVDEEFDQVVELVRERIDGTRLDFRHGITEG